jgi:hypothetical protein
MSELSEWVSSTAQGDCARLLSRFVQPLSLLDAEIQADVGSFGARFHVPAGLLCEISVFGELFIVRVGGDQGAEYRVRRESIALQALDQVLQRHVELKTFSQMPQTQEP